MKKIVLMSIVVAFVFVSCDRWDDFFPGGGNGREKDITFVENSLYPEGLAYDKQSDLFYVSSVRKGKIGKVNRDGKYRLFADDSMLISTIGMNINTYSRELYACISDPGVSLKSSNATAGKTAKLAIYNLDNGQRKKIIDLAKIGGDSSNFANDIAVDETTGNLYVTNSLAPVIYKIDKSGNAVVWARDNRFKGQGFNLNGIVFHPSRFIITAKSNSGELFKIDANNPANITKITVADSLQGADGLILNNPTELLVIRNSVKKVIRLKSTNNWQSAVVTGVFNTKDNFPTTGVEARGKNYVLNAKLNEIFGNDTIRSSSFTIQLVKF